MATISHDSRPPAPAVQTNCAGLSRIGGFDVDATSACLSCDSPTGITQLCEGA